ncbi:MAG: GntR family transcriptional regulator [Alphaproteobacteria bacterium]|nr:GntR family transcriptional regulator [Alphaproteobacteria bacterium]MDE2112241.1 GntR family transcriptional regulator [Alphaproteobacteria bacterium]MDE2494173.1 GntR family transcriptional regulator [Alphaproteobacteria bacterium]
MAIVVKTLSEQIYTVVRDRLVSGELPANAAIKQDALARQLGVSKIPLREAFARLERDGLLLSVTNRGFFVPPMSADEAEEVYALRLKIEPEAAGRAAKTATDKDRQAAREALRALQEAKAGDKTTSGRLHRAYHMALVQPTRHKITVHFIERLHIVAERYVNKHLEPTGRENRARREHKAILEAWMSGQSKTVRTMMHDHISSTLKDLRKQFEIEKALAS